MINHNEHIDRDEMLRQEQEVWRIRNNKTLEIRALIADLRGKADEAKRLRDAKEPTP